MGKGRKTKFNPVPIDFYQKSSNEPVNSTQGITNKNPSPTRLQPSVSGSSSSWGSDTLVCANAPTRHANSSNINQTSANDEGRTVSFQPTSQSLNYSKATATSSKPYNEKGNQTYSYPRRENERRDKQASQNRFQGGSNESRSYRSHDSSSYQNHSDSVNELSSRVSSLDCGDDSKKYKPSNQPFNYYNERGSRPSSIQQKGQYRENNQSFQKGNDHWKNDTKVYTSQNRVQNLPLRNRDQIRETDKNVSSPLQADVTPDFRFEISSSRTPENLKPSLSTEEDWDNELEEQIHEKDKNCERGLKQDTNIPFELSNMEIQKMEQTNVKETKLNVEAEPFVPPVCRDRTVNNQNEYKPMGSFNQDGQIKNCWDSRTFKKPESDTVSPSDNFGSENYVDEHKESIQITDTNKYQNPDPWNETSSPQSSSRGESHQKINERSKYPSKEIKAPSNNDRFYNASGQRQQRKGASLEGESENWRNRDDNAPKRHSDGNYSRGNVTRPSRDLDYNYEKKDEELRRFEVEERERKSVEFVKVIEKQQDLFAMPKEYSFAHCVAEDMRMGSGIAVTFKRDFKEQGDLLNQRQKSGGLATLELESDGGTRYIYYLVTKKVSNGKPTYESFFSSVKKMRDHIRDHNVTKLAIPRLGCGLDRLEWSRVKHMIEFIFKEVDVEIIVCNFQQNEDQPPPQNFGCGKIVNVEKSVADIEEYTIILYLSTENGDVSPEMESLAKKFSFMGDFKQASKKPGELIRYEKKNYILYGCIVRKTIKDPVNFKYLEKICVQINKYNKKDLYEYVAIQAISDKTDDLINEKIITILRNYLRNVDLYVCWTGDLTARMPASSF